MYAFRPDYLYKCLANNILILFQFKKSTGYFLLTSFFDIIYVTYFFFYIDEKVFH